MSLDEKKKNIILIIGILNQYIESKKKQIKPLQTRSSKPMKCIKCGVLLPKGSKFCDKCGAQQVIDKKCPNCGTIIEDTFKFCPECGVSFTNEKAAAKKENERKINEARIEGIKQAFSFLRNCGMDLDDGSFCDDVPLLIQASDNSEVEIVEALLSEGADVDIQDDDNNSALHKACENCNKDIVKILLEHNAYTDLENDYDETPLSIAREKGNRYIVGLLHKNGAIDDNDD